MYERFVMISFINAVRLTQSSRSDRARDRDRDLIEMIMGLSSNTYTNQQPNTNQQSGTGNRNYVFGSRRRTNWSRTPQDGRRNSRYVMLHHVLLCIAL
jgi:hypothetical protein